MIDGTKKTGQDYQVSEDTFEDAEDQSMLADVGETEEAEEPRQKGNQGFASMPKDKQREIASKGGKAAHQAGTAHEWNSEEAADAGRRGGQKRAA